MPDNPTVCPRCSAPVQTTPLTPPEEGEALGCTRCTWPNPSYMRMLATLARKGVNAEGYDMTDEGLETFVANLPDTTTLKDPQGRRVYAKVFEVHVHDGQVDVTFEFDPNAWVMVH